MAVWLDQPDIAPVDATVCAQIELAATALRKAGARVNYDARPNFDIASAHDTYMRLLMGLMSVGRPDFADMVERAESMVGDDSAYAQSLRYSTVRHNEFAVAENRRDLLRWAWHAFFKDYDVLLAPITITPAFLHDHSEPMAGRTVPVNGVDVPYFSQVFWAGLAIASYLPSTVAPVGKAPSGLPVGMQIIGAAYADRTTIWAAGQLAKLIGGFTPPPGY